MLPIIGPLVSAGANLLGGLLGNQQAAGQASAQRAWETEMSNTSWQRGVADMRAAGINPMLAYMQGGASTPGGAMAGVPNANVVGDAVSSALGTYNQMQQFKLMDQTIGKATADKHLAETTAAKADRQFVIDQMTPDGERAPTVGKALDFLDRSSALMLRQHQSELAGFQAQGAKMDLTPKHFMQRALLGDAGSAMTLARLSAIMRSLTGR